MDALKTLMAHCKCGVHLTVNEHRNYYETAEQRLDWYAELESPPTIADSIRSGILRTDVIVDLHFFPDTPIGSYHIVHFDIDQALQMALECIGAPPEAKLA